MSEAATETRATSSGAVRWLAQRSSSRPHAEAIR